MAEDEEKLARLRELKKSISSGKGHSDENFYQRLVQALRQLGDIMGKEPYQFEGGEDTGSTSSSSSSESSTKSLDKPEVKKQATNDVQIELISSEDEISPNVKEEMTRMHDRKIALAKLPFKCYLEDCSSKIAKERGFFCKGGLYYHLRKCHQVCHYKCNLCANGFPNLDSLKKHLTVKHPRKFRCRRPGCYRFYRTRKNWDSGH